VLTNGCAFGQTLPTYKWTATIKVVVEDGNPIAGANVAVSYTILPPPSDPNDRRYGEIKGATDTNGVFIASHTDSSWGLAIIVEKSGYYTTHIGHDLYQPGQFDDKTVTASRNPTIALVLKKIGKPIPMYAKRNNQMIFPEYNKAIGYDLMVGDWVGPYGKGINADLFFTEKHTDPQSDYILSMSFPKPGDGIQEFTVPDAEKGSGLRSSHEAPVDGYQPEVSQTEMTNPNRNFYFRVRTKLDENGNVVSARYGKIYGDLAQFTYYFNPTPNDRNIEFDPKQNLLGGLKSLEQVSQP
jgi:hypothetical protein